MSDPNLPPEPYQPGAVPSLPPVPAYGQQPVYGQQPAYPSGPAPTTSNDAVVALVLSICSWVFCPGLLAVLALVFAGKAKRAIDASGGWVTGDGMVTAAKVVAWINLGLTLAFVVIFVAVLVIGAVASTTSPGASIG